MCHVGNHAMWATIVNAMWATLVYYDQTFSSLELYPTKDPRTTRLFDPTTGCTTCSRFTLIKYKSPSLMLKGQNLNRA